MLKKLAKAIGAVAIGLLVLTISVFVYLFFFAPAERFSMYSKPPEMVANAKVGTKGTIDLRRYDTSTLLCEVKTVDLTQCIWQDKTIQMIK